MDSTRDKGSGTENVTATDGVAEALNCVVDMVAAVREGRLGVIASKLEAGGDSGEDSIAIKATVDEGMIGSIEVN